MADISLLCKNVILKELKKREPLFGQWRVGAFLGAGAFACVFKMEREDLGEHFVSALKVIPLTQERDETMRAEISFEETIGKTSMEIVHLYKLSGHTNVVSWHNHQVFHYHDGDTETALVSMMMDFLPNSLARELRNAPFPATRVLDILLDCLHGLEHIHRNGVIHRDLKPENIFITEDGVAKLGDFGIARQVSETMLAKTVAGTPAYMAPEVYRDPFGHGYDHQADLYSLALVGFEMLEGYLPYEKEAGSRVGMFKMRIKGDAPKFTRKLPPALELPLLKALNFDPRLRYESAVAFRKDLEKARSIVGEYIKPSPSLSNAAPQKGAGGIGALDAYRAALGLGKAKTPQPPAGKPTLRASHMEETVRREHEAEDTLVFQDKGPKKAVLDAGDTTILQQEETVFMPSPPDSGPASGPTSAPGDEQYEETVLMPQSGDAHGGALGDTQYMPPRDFQQASSESPAPVYDEDDDDDWAPPEDPDATIYLRQPEETGDAETESGAQAEEVQESFAAPSVDLATATRRLVRIVECDKATEFVYYSKRVCELFVMQGRDMVREHGYIPVEWNNKESARVDEEKICGWVLNVGLARNMLMAELAVSPDYEYEVGQLLDSETYVVTPKFLGLHFNRGEVKHVRDDSHLKLRGFSISRKTS